MTETVDDFNTGLRRAYDALQQEAVAIAQSPEIVDGLLLQIYDADERARYDAAQMLTLLPEDATGYADVRKTLITVLLREENPEIRNLLAQKLNAFVAAKDYLAFGVLQERAASDASVAVRRWCYSGMAGVHDDFIGEATHFLQAQRSSQPGYRSDIEESLTALKRRKRANLLSKIKNGVDILRVAKILTVVFAIAIVMLVQSDRLRLQSVSRVQKETLHGTQNALRDSQAKLQQQQKQLLQREKALVEAQQSAQKLRDALLKRDALLMSENRRTVEINSHRINETQSAMRLPGDIAHLQTPPPVVMGNDAPDAEVALVSPVGEYAEIQPLFCWKPFPNAVHYTLKVYGGDDLNTPVLKQSLSPPREQTGSEDQMFWETSRVLRPNTSYRWQVTAEFKDADAKPVFSALASFKTFTLTEALNLAVEHANRGMVTWARHELEAVLRSDPHNQAAQTRLAELKQKIKQISPQN